MRADQKSSVTVRVPAKVNVSLAVGPIRGDGYHPVHTVFQAVSLYDEVTVSVSPTPGVRITVTGQDAHLVPTGSDNLAARAAQLLADRIGQTPAVDVVIRKAIPVAGGMAGGSADAAATLVACDLLWQAGLSRDQLTELAAAIGSDVAFAVVGGTAIGAGRGELLTPVLARGKYSWVFAVVDQGLSTPAVYGEFDRLTAGIPLPQPRVRDAVFQALRGGEPTELAPLLHNDLQPAAFSLRPELVELMRVGLACRALGGVVSGSGPTVAFLVRDYHHAMDLAVGLVGVECCLFSRYAYGPVPGVRVVEGPSDWDSRDGVIL
ncbi:MAG: 4-(cytidine 5'-diphospho)-2-C-methyl-D-erythritol kinase [Actinomycetota bacterium]